MEDDDEFGDLYTDVLRPFSSSSSSAPQITPAPILQRSIDLNRHSDDETPHEDSFSRHSVNPVLQLPIETPSLPPIRDPTPASSSGFVLNLTARNDNEGFRVKVEEDLACADVELPKRALDDRDFGVKSEFIEKDVNLMDKDVKFDIEEVNAEIEDVGLEPIIPGLAPDGGMSIHASAGNLLKEEDFIMDDAAPDRGDGGDDWDSDSEDDLQIVLNDNDRGLMAMDRGGMEGDDEDDEDGHPLVILGDNDQNQVMEEQEWGDDAVQAVDGERKELGDAAKSGGGMVLAPKLGYSSYGYRPFHSQYKYVRPGAAPFPGTSASGPGGAPNQARPLVNIGTIGGRGRGDWRPSGAKDSASVQKGFHPGFGMPGWGNNMGGRGFGGLEFTLPSHKTIFEVDIDSFEEKPWKLSGVDVSDFFNFGLNEDSWKEYCKQLEQLRLEATMQSKIRVYESGRTEQGYDPDLPPELAAAAGAHDVPGDHNNGKSDALQNDVGKGSTRVRPPLPTGRAIQVEGGYGERLPSIDTRPPRIRDSDAIIEIVLQDSLDDDSSTGNCTPNQQNDDLSRKDFKVVHEAEEDIAQIDAEYPDNFSETQNTELREPVGRRNTSMNSDCDNIREDASLPLPLEDPVHYPRSRSHTPAYSAPNLGITEERPPKGKTHNKSPHSPRQNLRDRKFPDSQEEESIDSMDGKHSPPISSPVMLEAAQESGAEDKDTEHDELIEADRNTEIDMEDVNFVSTINAIKSDRDDEVMENNEKLGSILEPTLPKEVVEADDDDSQAASSENRKTRSGSSRDYQKWQDGMEDEVFQDQRSSSMGSVKKYIDEGEQNFRRKGNGDRQDERNRVEIKGRKESYAYRDWDPSLAHQHHLKTDGFDRQKERSNADWQRRDDDPYYRKTRAEETRKREHDDELGSRHRGKIREIERSDKDERHLTKKLDNGSYRVHYDKSTASRHRERDDSLKSRYENVDSYYNKKRKDEEHLRRDHVDKEETLHGKRESKSRRKRERDEVFEQPRRDEMLRVRDNVGDHHSVGHKEEWLLRERVDRQRDKEEWHRLKQSREENLSKRDRDEVRGSVRGGHGAEDKAWVGHVRVKDENKVSEKEYQVKDLVRHNEQTKRRDRTEEESSRRGREDTYSRRNPLIEEKRSRPEKSTGERHAVNALDNQRIHDKRHKESTMKSREVDASDHNATGPSRKNLENHNSYRNQMVLKGSDDHGEPGHSAHHHGSRKHIDDASSDDEQQDSRRGRSKLERWTSHKERDFNINNKTSSSLRSKEIENNNGGSSEAVKHPDDPSKAVEPVDSHVLAEKKDTGDLESKGGGSDNKVLDDRHMDTVEKLKKRSERFKLPMPSEKEALVIKKMESEALPSSKSEAPADLEIKPERPARKRRWISSS